MPAPKGNKFSKNGGRPRKVNEKDLPDLGLQMVEWLREHLDNLDKWKKPAFISSFAITHDLSKYNLNDYADENKVFSNHYKKAKEVVKQILIQGALKGYWNSTAFIFTAKNETDMKDKQEVEHSGKIASEVDVTDNRKVDEITKEYEEKLKLALTK